MSRENTEAQKIMNECKDFDPKELKILNEGQVVTPQKKKKKKKLK